MKLGVGALDLPGTATGIGVFSEHVTRGLLARHEEAKVYAAYPPIESEFPGRVTLLAQRGFRKGWPGVIERLWIYQAKLRRQLARDRIDLFYSTVHEAVLWPPCDQVVTLYDLIPLIQTDAHPKLRRFFQLFFPVILKRAKGVVCISEATQRDLEKHFGWPAEKTCVAYLGCDHDHFHPKPGKVIRSKSGFERYFLVLGSTAPHKNIRRVVEALAAIPDPSCGLAIVGPEDPRTGFELREAAAAHGLGDRVHFFGRVPYDELPHWYSEAQGLVFASLYEGFGIPALEAMACGCPVIASRVSSLPEVCGDASLYVDPLQTGTIARAMERILREDGLAEDLRRKGLARAAGFTWDKTVATIHDFLLRANEI